MDSESKKENGKLYYTIYRESNRQQIYIYLRSKKWFSLNIFQSEFKCYVHTKPPARATNKKKTTTTPEKDLCVDITMKNVLCFDEKKKNQLERNNKLILYLNLWKRHNKSFTCIYQFGAVHSLQILLYGHCTTCSTSHQ